MEVAGYRNRDDYHYSGSSSGVGRYLDEIAVRVTNVHRSNWAKRAAFCHGAQFDRNFAMDQMLGYIIWSGIRQKAEIVASGARSATGEPSLLGDCDRPQVHFLDAKHHTYPRFARRSQYLRAGHSQNPLIPVGGHLNVADVENDMIKCVDRKHATILNRNAR